MPAENDSRVSEKKRRTKAGETDSRASAPNSIPEDEDDENILLSALRRFHKREKSTLNPENFAASGQSSESDEDCDLPLSVLYRINVQERSTVSRNESNDFGVSGMKMDVGFRVMENKSWESAFGNSNLALKSSGGKFGQLWSADVSGAREFGQVTINKEDFRILESNGSIRSSNERSSACDDLMLSSLFRVEERGFGVSERKNDSSVSGGKEDFRVVGGGFGTAGSYEEQNYGSFNQKDGEDEKSSKVRDEENCIEDSGNAYGVNDFIADKDSCNSEEENDFGVSKEKGESGYHGFQRFKVGDMVWAKAFPYTWWPGWILRRAGLRVSVSFFGCERSGLFQESEICGFEENYSALSKMVAVKLSDVIMCALEELCRRVVLELSCPCLNLTEDMEVRKLINVGDLSNEFVEAKKGFAPVKVLGAVLKMAVCAQVESVEAVRAARAVGQVNAFRRYVSIRPDWVYYETMRLSESSSISDYSEGTDLEMLSHASSENEVMYDDILEAKDNIQVDEQEDEPEVFSWQEQRETEVCTTNRQDFSVLSPSEDLTPLQDQLKDVDDSSFSIQADFGIKEVLMEQNLAAACVPPELGTEEMTPSSVCGVDPLLHPAKGTTEIHPAHEVGVANEMTDMGQLSQHIGDGRTEIHQRDIVGDAAVTTDDENNDKKIISSLKCPTSCSEDSSSRKRRLDELVVSDLPFKLHKTQPSVHESRIFSPVRDPNSLRPRNTADPAYEGMMQLLHDMLRHLRCLAFNPFYSGKGKLKSIQWTILKYRSLVSRNISDFASAECTSGGSHTLKITKVLEVSGHGSLLHLSTNTSKSCLDDGVGFVHDGNNEPMVFSDAGDISNVIHAGDKISIATRVHDSESGTNKVSCSSSCPSDRYAKSVLGKRRFDGPVASGLPFKSLKAGPSVSVSETCRVKSRSETESPTLVDSSIEPQLILGTRAYQVEESISEPIHGMLRSLRCLALDPFYSGEESFRSVHARFLNYRYLVYQNISDLTSVKYTSNGDHALEAMNIQQKMSMLKPLLCFGDDIAKIDPDDMVVVQNDAIAETRLTSHVIDDMTKQPSDTSDFSTNKIKGKSDGTGVICSSNGLPELPALETLDISNNAVEAYHGVKVCVETEGTNNAQLSSRIIDDSQKISTEVCGLRRPEENSRDSLHGRRRHSQLLNSSLPFKSKISQFYASPLLKDGLNESIDTHRISEKGGGGAGSQVCLHMKFPKDFRLPTKDELVRKFIRFGQLDISSTRVFFYTGSGQVVFLDHRDAEAACRYAKKKKLFGEANVRFWLSHRNGKSQVSILSAAGQPASNIKSCLKTFNAHGKQDQRQPSGVRFLTRNQDNSLSAKVRKNRLVTFSDMPCNHSIEIAPDISLQMILLLERCDQMVCKITNSLGLESYYSIFTHFCSYIPDLYNES